MNENLITEVDILDEAKDTFLTYAEEVLVDRSIPSAEDGLLSAQRKLIWTMENQMRMDSNSKTKKCSSIVGKALCDVYIHGESACYGVLRKMSLDFLMRYPLVAGQGQLGTQQDNDLFSSQRYTEAKPSIFSDLMMQDYNKETVPVKDTYTGEFKEPVVLPASFPNAICNGIQAIGVSLSHNSMPHNLSEVCDACIEYLRNPDMTVDDLLKIMPGPDFPLGGIILNQKDVREAFRTGRSAVSLKVIGDYEIKGNDIIFTSIPYRTYRNKIREQIEKNVDILDEYIADFDDESSVGQNRLIFHLKPNIKPALALQKLFDLTDLRTTLSYNMNYIVNGTPRQCSMLDLIKYYLIHQEKVLVNATVYDRQKAIERLHILRGLISAIEQIDKTIRIIRSQTDKKSCISALISEGISEDEIQAEAVYNMRLGRLSKLSVKDLRNEASEKEAFIKECDYILSSEDHRKEILKERILKMKSDFGDRRRSKFLTEVEIIPPEEVIDNRTWYVGVDNKFNVKRSLEPFNKKGMLYTGEGKPQEVLRIFLSSGESYRLYIKDVPQEFTPLNDIIIPEVKEFPCGFYTNETDEFAVIFTRQGYAIKIAASKITAPSYRRTLYFKLRPDDFVFCVKFCSNDDQLLIVKSNGQALRLPVERMPEVKTKGSKGRRGVGIIDKEVIHSVIKINPSKKYLMVDNKVHFLSDIDTSYFGSMGQYLTKMPFKKVSL